MQSAHELHVLSHLLVQSNVLDSSHGLGIDGGLMRLRTPTMELHLLKFPPSQAMLSKSQLPTAMHVLLHPVERLSVGDLNISEMAQTPTTRVYPLMLLGSEAE